MPLRVFIPPILRIAAGLIDVASCFDGVVRPGPQPRHRLRHDVRGGVAQDVSPIGTRWRNDRHRVTVVQWSIQVNHLTVDGCGEGILGEACTNLRRQVKGGRAFRNVTGAAVWEKNFDVRHGGLSLPKA